VFIVTQQQGDGPAQRVLRGAAANAGAGTQCRRWDMGPPPSGVVLPRGAVVWVTTYRPAEAGAGRGHLPAEPCLCLDRASRRSFHGALLPWGAAPMGRCGCRCPEAEAEAEAEAMDGAGIGTGMLMTRWCVGEAGQRGKGTADVPAAASAPAPAPAPAPAHMLT
jgi:hypothetical protein